MALAHVPETLRAGESAMVVAGRRDAAFLNGGSSEVMQTGNVSQRVATAEASIRVRLPAVQDYSATLRMDPFPRPLHSNPPRLPVVDVSLNGKPLPAVALSWNAERVGSYEIVLPRQAVRPGTNQLVLKLRRPASNAGPIQPGISDGDAVGLWYLRIRAR